MKMSGIWETNFEIFNHFSEKEMSNCRESCAHSTSNHLSMNVHAYTIIDVVPS